MMKQTLVGSAIALSMWASSCSPQHPQTLAELLPGGEWACLESGGSEFWGATRFRWGRDGMWSQHSTVNFADNGDTVSFEATISGGYRVEGNRLSMKGERAQVGHVTRNGVLETLPEQEKARIEREILVVDRGDWQEISHWDAGTVVLKDGDKGITCTR